MKAVRVHGPSDLRVDDIEPPIPGPRDVVVRTAVAGICGSDITFTRVGGVAGPQTEPFGLGHELAGTVAFVGDEVADINVGDRVTVNPMGDGNAIGNGVPEGAFAPLLLVRDATLGGSIYRLPNTVSFEQAAMTEPLSVALHAVSRSAASPTDRVVVFGAGPIGLGIVAFLRQRGVSEITVVDMSSSRLQRARDLGATHTVHPAEVEPFDALAAQLGSSSVFGWPVVNANLWFEATGSGPVLQSIIAMAPSRARMVVVAVHHTPVPVDFQMALGKELDFTMSLAYPDEFPEVIAILESGTVDVSAMISHRLPSEDFIAAFAIAQDKEASAKVLVTFEE